MNTRKELIRKIADNISAINLGRIVKVAIDGVDGSGKTTLADELASILEYSSRQIIRSSVDGFHNPREIRYRLGNSSPEGFFKDSYNYSKLIDLLLRPLSSGGNTTFKAAYFDHRVDSTVDAPERYAKSDAILIFDGIFLHRDELVDFWDYSIFLDVDFPVSIGRCAQRGDGSPDVNAESNRRYVEGQKMYISSCAPRKRAKIVVDNNNLEAPFIKTVNS